MSDPAPNPPRGPGPIASCALGLATAALLLAAFAPVGFWPAAMLLPAPLAVLAERQRTGARRPIVLALAFAAGTIPAWAVMTRWTASVSALGYVPLVGYLALFPLLKAWITLRVVRRWPRLPLAAVLPVVWVGVDLLRGEIVLTGFAWYFAAHPLLDGFGGGLARPAAWAGVYAVTLLATLPVVGVADGLRRRPRAAAACGAMVLGWLGVALAPWEPPRGETIRLAVAQTNVPQSVRGGWSPEAKLDTLRTTLALAEAAVETDPPPDLLLWPETMFPGRALEPDAASAVRGAREIWPVDNGTDILADEVREVYLSAAQASGVPWVVGATGYDRLAATVDPETARIAYTFDAAFNAAFVLERGDVAVRYEKVELTPFGEVIPGLSAWPAVESFIASLGVGAEGMSFAIDAGRAARPLPVRTTRLGEVSVATPICFEATRGRLCRRLVYDSGERRAGLLLNLTNDGWFGGTDAGREHHLLHARWRCVELGTPMARAANTGVSALVDSRGRVVARGVEGDPDGHETAGVLRGSLPLGGGATPYAVVGDAAGWTMFWAAVGLGVSTVRGSRRGGRPADTSATGGG